MKAGRRGWESPGALLPELGHGGLWAPPPPTKHSPSPAPACCVGKVPGFLGGDLLPALLSQLLRTRWRLGQHLSSPGTSAPASLSRSFLVSVSILSQHPNPRLDPVVGGSWGGRGKGSRAGGLDLGWWWEVVHLLAGEDRGSSLCAGMAGPSHPDSPCFPAVSPTPRPQRIPRAHTPSTPRTRIMRSCSTYPRCCRTPPITSSRCDWGSGEPGRGAAWAGPWPELCGSPASPSQLV